MQKCSIDYTSGRSVPVSVAENAASSSRSSKNRFVKTQKALHGSANNYSMTFKKHSDSVSELASLKQALTGDVNDLLNQIVRDNQEKSHKFSIAIFSQFYDAVDTKKMTDPPPVFHSESSLLSPSATSEEISKMVDAADEYFRNEIEKFIYLGSGWVLSKILRMDVQTIESDPISSGTYIELPKKFSSPNQGLINIDNKDNRCLLYCLSAWRKKNIQFVKPMRAYHYTDLLDSWNITGKYFIYIKHVSMLDE
jgi:hypothetical protein